MCVDIVVGKPRKHKGSLHTGASSITIKPPDPYYRWQNPPSDNNDLARVISRAHLSSLRIRSLKRWQWKNHHTNVTALELFPIFDTLRIHHHKPIFDGTGVRFRTHPGLLIRPGGNKSVVFANTDFGCMHHHLLI